MTGKRHPPMEGVKHGTVVGYDAGCGCGYCNQAHRKREKYRITRPPPPSDSRHGTWDCYCTLKCRCERCTAAGRKQQADLRRRYLENPIPFDDPRHGSGYAYRTLGCRCLLCTEAQAAEFLAIVHARAPLPPGDPRHGSTNGYGNWRCRCHLCTEAHRVAGVEYAARKQRAARMNVPFVRH
jgi:hypothetical protein